MSTSQITIPVKPPRRFLPDDLRIESWEGIEKYFVELRDRKINSKEELKNWLMDISEVEAVLEEDGAWRYINMSIETANQEYVDSYNFYVTEIVPKISPFENEFNKKLIASEFINDLEKEKYRIYLRGIKKQLEILILLTMS